MPINNYSRIRTASLKLKPCHDCKAIAGMRHQPGCDVERCSVCGGQRIQCNCRQHDPGFARWTGLWPGEAEAMALGLNLNDMAAFRQVFFVKPKARP